MFIPFSCSLCHFQRCQLMIKCAHYLFLVVVFQPEKWKHGAKVRDKFSLYVLRLWIFLYTMICTVDKYSVLSNVGRSVSTVYWQCCSAREQNDMQKYGNFVPTFLNDIQLSCEKDLPLGYRKAWYISFLKATGEYLN